MRVRVACLTRVRAPLGPTRPVRMPGSRPFPGRFRSVAWPHPRLGARPALSLWAASSLGPGRLRRPRALLGAFLFGGPNAHVSRSSAGAWSGRVAARGWVWRPQTFPTVPRPARWTWASLPATRVSSGPTGQHLSVSGLFLQMQSDILILAARSRITVAVWDFPVFARSLSVKPRVCVHSDWLCLFFTRPGHQHPQCPRRLWPARSLPEPGRWWAEAFAVHGGRVSASRWCFPERGCYLLARLGLQPTSGDGACFCSAGLRPVGLGPRRQAPRGFQTFCAGWDPFKHKCSQKPSK